MREPNFDSFSRMTALSVGLVNFKCLAKNQKIFLKKKFFLTSCAAHNSTSNNCDVKEFISRRF